MHLTYLQGIFLGLIQGITELFPVSSLGHAVLVPAWVGGSLGKVASEDNGSYLSITVAMHLASAIALLLVFRSRWVQLIGAGLTSLRNPSGLFQQAKLSSSARVFWLIVVATIPAGLLGIVFQKHLTKIFGDPKYTAIFLTVNGLILILAERLSRRTKVQNVQFENQDENIEIAAHIRIPSALAIGVGQSAALFAGISRFGITTSAGLLRGLNHRVASDFAFLLSLPIIAAAALVKLPHLLNSSQDLGPILAGSLVSFFATFVSIKFLVKWFKTRTLYPFAFYCLIVGVVSIVKFG
jgi:undecaprenyl-diphosphatase